MKKATKVVALMLILVMVSGCLAACGEKQGGSEKKENSATDIEISYWNAGLGSDWLEAVVDAFNEAYPEYNAYFSASAAAGTVKATYGMEGDTVDLYMANREWDTSKMEPLDELLTTTADGDKKTIGEKFEPGYLALEKAGDGHYYQLTYGGGVCGIVYNKEQFKEAGITQLPRTTNELAIAADKLKTAGKKAFAHYANNGYWTYMSEAWFSQYEGFDYYLNNFYACTDENGTSPSKDIFTKKDGRYEVLKAYGKLITPEYVMEGSNSIDHVNAQTQFLNGSAAMMVTGSWLSSEMAASDKLGMFSMMRTPVLSAVTDKCTTVKSEGDLRKVISAIDSILDGEKTEADYADGENFKVENLSVSAADWNYLTEARCSVPTNYSGEGCFIPTYSNAKEGAKEFLKFFYSDAGIKAYVDAVKVPLPLSLSDGTAIDTSKFNEFQKSQFDMLAEAKITPTYDNAAKHRIFVDGGASSFMNLNYITYLCASNPDDRKTVNQIWDEMMQTVEDNYETWVSDIK